MKNIFDKIKTSLWILLVISIFTINAKAQGNHITVDVENVLYDESGAVITPGKITLSFNSDLFPVYLDAEGPNTASGCFFDPPGIDPVTTYEVINIGIGSKCAGEYCFEIIAGYETDNECCQFFCVEVKSCFWVEEPDKFGNPGISYIACHEHEPSDDPNFGLITNDDDQLQIIEKTTQDDIRSNVNHQIFENKLDEVELNISNIYPNPFRDNINLEINSNKKDELRVLVFNNISKVLLEKTIGVESGENLINLNLDNNIPAGLYFISIQSLNYPQKNKPLVRKIIHIRN